MNNIDTQKIDIAAISIINFLRQGSIDDNKIVADYFLYTAASLAGISCAVTAQRHYIENKLKTNNETAVLAAITTESGDFFYGNLINELLFANKYSVWNMLKMAHKADMPDFPDIQEITAEVSDKIGNKNAKIWNDLRNPYKEIGPVKQIYALICDNLEFLDMSIKEINIAFIYALVNVINETYSFFPKELNCIELSLDTIIFFAHMNVNYTY